MRDRPRKKRQDFDGDDKRQDVDRDAFWDEQVEEVQPVSPKPVNEHGQEDRDCECGRDDDVTGDCEGIRNQAEHVQSEHEHENRKYEGKEFHALSASGRSHGGGHKFVG